MAQVIAILLPGAEPCGCSPRTRRAIPRCWSPERTGTKTFAGIGRRLRHVWRPSPTSCIPLGGRLRFSPRRYSTDHAESIAPVAGADLRLVIGSENSTSLRVLNFERDHGISANCDLDAAIETRQRRVGDDTEYCGERHRVYWNESPDRRIGGVQLSLAWRDLESV